MHPTAVLGALLIFPTLRNKWYAAAALLSNVIPSLITQVIKSSVNAPRPLNYFNEAAWIHTLPEWPRLMQRSFPSGHTCSAFCLFCFLSLLLPPRYKAWGLFFLAIALLIGVSRIYLAAHFFADIYAGSIVGTTFTVGIVYLLETYGGFFFRYTSAKQ